MLSHIGKYEVKKLLGKGATGSVYLASDTFASREVALKVMQELPSDPEEARRMLRFFQNEAALAGKLRHPHIVSILDAGVEEVSGGEPLQAALKRQPYASGSTPAYADYILLSVFQWARVMSPQEVLTPESAISAWRERMLDLYDGFARNVPTA